MELRIRKRSAAEYYESFLLWDIERQATELTHRSPEFWEEIGGEKALETFHEAAEKVPAYKKFLAENGIDHREVVSLEDFKKVPPVNKENYLRRYPLHELCWDGALTKMNVVSVSSGTSGKPFFWPRDIWQEHEVDHYYELTLRYLFSAHEKKTLILVAFAMGMYIAGPFTFASCLRIAQKGYPISIATPSNDIEAILKVVQDLSGEFDQVIIGGYPPLVRDIIDSGVRAGINWKEKNTKLFFGGESFSEKWRDYILSLVNGGSSLGSAVNMYGTADAALLGIETPTSISLRKVAATDPKALKDIFNSERLPSVLSYNPLLNYFETTESGNLLFTSSSGIPLIRYSIGDVGGIVSYDDALRVVSENAILFQEYEKQNVDWKLPLVYLFGRDDFTVVLYGANVYPENIKEALDDPRINHLVSGKFVLSKGDRRDLSPYLDLKIEMAQGIKPEKSMVNLIKRAIVETMVSKNSEYADVYNTRGKKAEPRIKLEEYMSKNFKFGVKHRWVQR